MNYEDQWINTERGGLKMDVVDIVGEHLANDKKLRAIKVIKDNFGVSLLTAKHFVEEIMAQEERNAIDKSIAHWKDVYQKVYDLPTTGDDCPLCEKYPVRCMNRKEELCPIAKKVGRKGCEGTPYERVVAAERDLLKEIRAEITFLKSL
jgi:hypothetical protein